MTTLSSTSSSGKSRQAVLLLVLVILVAVGGIYLISVYGKGGGALTPSATEEQITPVDLSGSTLKQAEFKKLKDYSALTDLENVEKGRTNPFSAY